MDTPVELIPLLCPKCSTPIPAEPDETAWVCLQCGQGLLLDEEAGLKPVEVSYSAALPPQVLGRPYWVADGRVALDRQVYESSRGAANDSLAFWAAPRRFFVPAFTCTLEELLKDATDRLQEPPLLQAGPPTKFQPVTLPVSGLQPAADFIVMAIEAGRKDKLREVRFSLQLSPPVLWVLP